ncbi:MAG: hypothetical protein HYS13_06600 [Planctomycetia bacterium]|nr:hypothetical protein [Planctomycetia bacterium]
MKRFITVLLAAWLVAAWAAVSLAQEPPKKDQAPPKTEKLEPYECGKVQRLHTLSGVFLASQPQKEDFQHAKDGGIKTVVNLRKKEELDWDEEAHVRELGMAYLNFPFQAPKELTDEVFNGVRKLLVDKEKRPLLLHCASANRVGAIWLAHRVLDGGLTYEAALEEAKTVGLKLPAYEEKAKEYIERMKKQSKEAEKK